MPQSFYSIRCICRKIVFNKWTGEVGGVQTLQAFQRVVGKIQKKEQYFLVSFSYILISLQVQLLMFQNFNNDHVAPKLFFPYV
jgi:NhaP-type Na+/H+ and K+/H+ antiporter